MKSQDEMRSEIVSNPEVSLHFKKTTEKLTTIKQISPIIFYQIADIENKILELYGILKCANLLNAENLAQFENSSACKLGPFFSLNQLLELDNLIYILHLLDAEYLAQNHLTWIFNQLNLEVIKIIFEQLKTENKLNALFLIMQRDITSIHAEIILCLHEAKKLTVSIVVKLLDIENNNTLNTIQKILKIFKAAEVLDADKIDIEQLLDCEPKQLDDIDSILTVCVESQSNIDFEIIYPKVAASPDLESLAKAIRNLKKPLDEKEVILLTTHKNADILVEIGQNLPDNIEGMHSFLINVHDLKNEIALLDRDLFFSGFGILKNNRLVTSENLIVIIQHHRLMLKILSRFQKELTFCSFLKEEKSSRVPVDQTILTHLFEICKTEQPFNVVFQELKKYLKAVETKFIQDKQYFGWEIKANKNRFFSASTQPITPNPKQEQINRVVEAITEEIINNDHYKSKHLFLAFHPDRHRTLKEAFAEPKLDFKLSDLEEEKNGILFREDISESTELFSEILPQLIERIQQKIESFNRRVG